MRPRLLSLVFPLLALAGCFMGYDSRWGQAKAAQQHNAQAAAPGEIRAAGEEAPPRSAPVRAMRVRVYASPGYEAQALDWQRQVREVMSDASGVLGPALGVGLEPVSFETWDPQGAEQDLATALRALAARDPGGGADWVVAFLAELPMATDSFHQAGMAAVLGKYLVVRAKNLAAEQALAKSFDRLDVDQREELLKQRRRHRAMALLLHELGHTLGAMHDTARDSVMYPQYGAGMTGFRDEDVALMRVTLRHHDDPPTADAQRALAEELLAAIDAAPGASWVPADRETEVALLKSAIARAPAAAPSSSAASPPAAASVPADVAPLSVNDRDAFAAATDAQRRGDLRAAWEAARPLFAKYPDVYAVQDLRCKLAMQIGGDFEATRAECDPLMKLTTRPNR